MAKRTVYIHTIDGQPGVFRDAMICFATKYGPASVPAESLRQIRREQRINGATCHNLGIVCEFSHDYIRYTV